MLINIYLISTLISVLIMLRNEVVFNNMLYKKGYRYKDKKFIEKISDFFKDMFLLLMPIFNIIIAVFLFFFMESVFDDTFDTLFEEGKVERIKK